MDARCKLTQEQFERRFVEQVQQGNPWETWIPFYFLSQRNGHYHYFGQYKENRFELTDSAWFYSSGVIVEGRYVDKTARIVQFTLRIIPFEQFLMWLTIIGGFLLANVALISMSVDNPMIYLRINGLVGVLILLAIVAQRFKLRRIRRQFMEEFELTENGGPEDLSVNPQ